MTINIALATNEAVILGCDSISSASRVLVDPFNMQPARDSDGNEIRDGNGHPVVALSREHFQQHVVTVFSGVEKMFLLCQKEGLSVAAVTSGLGALAGQSIKALADEFRSTSCAEFEDVQSVANSFLDFFRERYDQSFAESKVPEEYWDDLDFLVAGACANSAVPELYRVSIKNRTLVAALPGDDQTGLVWAAQADGVERLIYGIDSQLAQTIQDCVNVQHAALYETWSNRVKEIVESIVALSGAGDLVDGLDLTLPPPPDIELPWVSAQVEVPFSSLPLQYAIDFVGFLVMAQSGIQRFTQRIATVGGRTHIGIIRKGYDFIMMDEPAPKHRMTGFSDDA